MSVAGTSTGLEHETMNAYVAGRGGIEIPGQRPGVGWLAALGLASLVLGGVLVGYNLSKFEVGTGQQAVLIRGAGSTSSPTWSSRRRRRRESVLQGRADRRPE